MKIMIVVVASFVFGPGLIFAQVEPPKSARQLAAEISAAKDTPQKDILLAQLRKLKPQSAKDVKELVNASRETKDIDIKESAGVALQHVGPADKNNLAAAYIKALDEKDWRTRISLIVGATRLRSTDVTIKFRSIVKEAPRKNELKMLEANDKEGRKSAWATYSSPAMAARMLGELKDEESIPLLVSKYNDLGDASAEALAQMGKKAVLPLLGLARKEVGGNDTPAMMALGQISDVAAKDDLLKIFKEETNRDIRRNVMHSLVNQMYGADVFDTVKEVYVKEKDPSLLFGLKTKNGIPFLTEVLRTDRNYDAREVAILMLEEIGDKSAVPALEDALTDESLSIRQLSGHALKKLTGKNYEWRK